MLTSGCRADGARMLERLREVTFVELTEPDNKACFAGIWINAGKPVYRDRKVPDHKHEKHEVEKFVDELLIERLKAELRRATKSVELLEERHKNDKWHD